MSDSYSNFTFKTITNIECGVSAKWKDWTFWHGRCVELAVFQRTCYLSLSFSEVRTGTFQIKHVMNSRFTFTFILYLVCPQLIRPYVSMGFSSQTLRPLGHFVGLFSQSWVVFEQCQVSVTDSRNKLFWIKLERFANSLLCLLFWEEKKHSEGIETSWWLTD